MVTWPSCPCRPPGTGGSLPSAHRHHARHPHCTPVLRSRFHVTLLLGAKYYSVKSAKTKAKPRGPPVPRENGRQRVSSRKCRWLLCASQGSGVRLGQREGHCEDHQRGCLARSAATQSVWPAGRDPGVSKAQMRTTFVLWPTAYCLGGTSGLSPCAGSHGNGFHRKTGEVRGSMHPLRLQ